MTPEEFREFVKDENNLATFASVAKELGFESQDDVQGLKASRDKVLAELKATKSKVSEFEEKYKMLDADDINDYLANRNQPQGGDKIKADDLPEYKRLKADHEKLSNDLKAINDEYNREKVSSTLSEVLENTGFKTHKQLLKQAYQGKAIVEIEDGKRTVYINDENGIQIPAKEYFQAYANSESGKLYLDQPENKGAGSQSFKGGGGAKVMPLDAFNKLSPADRFAFTNEGGTVTD